MNSKELHTYLNLSTRAVQRDAQNWWYAEHTSMSRKEPSQTTKKQPKPYGLYFNVTKNFLY